MKESRHLRARSITTPSNTPSSSSSGFLWLMATISPWFRSIYTIFVQFTNPSAQRDTIYITQKMQAGLWEKENNPPDWTDVEKGEVHLLCGYRKSGISDLYTIHTQVLMRLGNSKYVLISKCHQHWALIAHTPMRHITSIQCVHNLHIKFEKLTFLK